VRVLVVGSLPPPESARAQALLAEVVGLLAAGNTVEVAAPDPVATAHRYITVGGVPGCLRLWTMVAGFDSVVVQLQPGLPVRQRAGRLERELSLVALSLVLRRGRHVVLRLERLEDLPGGRVVAAHFCSGAAPTGSSWEATASERLLWPQSVRRSRAR
jgi:hypothetical protein